MDTTKEITQPLVSILMLTYNRANFLPEAIESVLHQTCSDWELVIIDDGSTDGTKDLIASYTDPRIRYIRHEDNAGLFVRRTESLSYATGVYTAILDSDDYWPSENKLTEQVAFLDINPEYVIVGTQAELIDAEGKNLGSYQVATTDTDIRNRILRRNQFIHSSLLIRTETLKETDGYQPTLAEDLELVLQLGKHGKLANLPLPHTAHREHADSQNDHGIKMARGVDWIIARHAYAYPHAISARLFSKLRLSLGSLKAFLSQ